MGNTESSSPPTGCLRHKNNSKSNNSNPEQSLPSLAMMAVAQKIFLKKVHILILRYAMAKHSDDFGMIERQGFNMALTRANLSNITNVFDLLFSMWDNADDGKVSYKEFCLGISPLACPSDNLSVILRFALHVCDDLDRKRIERKKLQELLTGINSTASYFGDAHLLTVEIDDIVEAVFEEEESISHDKCVKQLSTNPYIKRFVSGKARSNVRFRDVLETNYIFDKEKLVTEYIIDGIDIQIPPAYGKETGIVSKNWRSASSSISSRAYNKYKNKNDKPSAASTKSHKSFVDVPLTTTRCDENSGIHGNSMIIMASDGSRDPPPSVGSSKSGSYNRPRSVENSYLTYPRTTVASPSPSTPTPNDPLAPTTMFLRHRQRVHFRNFDL